MLYYNNTLLTTIFKGTHWRQFYCSKSDDAQEMCGSKFCHCMQVCVCVCKGFLSHTHNIYIQGCGVCCSVGMHRLEILQFHCILHGMLTDRASMCYCEVHALVDGVSKQCEFRCFR